MRLQRGRAAVSAIISTLLIIAIAVTLSAALFVSTTGYLSSLVSSGSNQQPGQSRAEESLLSIENTHAVAYSSGYPSDGYVMMYVRNVGGTQLTLGSVTVTAPPTNGGLTKSFSSVLTGSTWGSVGTSVLVSSEATTATYCGVAGTASGTGELTSILIDSGSPGWLSNQWAGYTVTITAGTDVGQTQVISSNTANTLSIAGTWSAKPDATSVYAINPSPVVTTLALEQTAVICITWSHGASPHPLSGDAFQIQISSTVGTSSIASVNVP